MWRAADDEAREAILSLVRSVARDHGLVAADTPIRLTDRVF